MITAGMKSSEWKTLLVTLVLDALTRYFGLNLVPPEAYMGIGGYAVARGLAKKNGS